MKLISLNTWGGHEFDALTSFVKAHAESTDAFCFQEVFSSPQSVTSHGTRMNIFEELEKMLPRHQAFFAPIQDNIDEEGVVDISSTFGQAIFVRKDLQVEAESFVFTRGVRNGMQGDDITTLAWGFQHIRVKNGVTPFTVVGIHGISEPGDKLDTPERLVQSKKLKDFLEKSVGQKILCGDFNLMPETKSVTMLEEHMKNLIKEFHISDTRGEIDRKKYPNDHMPQHFADYCFVSPDINVISFHVPNVPASDHLPLILEFS